MGIISKRIKEAQDKVVEVNPDDKGFWRHSYKICMHLAGCYIVHADDESSALDELIDYAEEQGWEGWFFTHEQIEELEREGYLEEYYYGGSHGRYLNFESIKIEEI